MRRRISRDAEALLKWGGGGGADEAQEEGKGARAGSLRAPHAHDCPALRNPSGAMPPLPVGGQRPKAKDQPHGIRTGFCWKGQNSTIARLVGLWVSNSKDPSEQLKDLASNLLGQVDGKVGWFRFTAVAPRPCLSLGVRSSRNGLSILAQGVW